MDEVKLKVVVDDVLEQIEIQGRQQVVMQQCIDFAQLQIDSVNYIDPQLEENLTTDVVMGKIVREQTKAIPEYEASKDRAFVLQQYNIVALSSLQKICPHTNNTVEHRDEYWEYVICDLCTLRRKIELPPSLQQNNSEGEGQA